MTYDFVPPEAWLNVCLGGLIYPGGDEAALALNAAGWGQMAGHKGIERRRVGRRDNYYPDMVFAGFDVAITTGSLGESDAYTDDGKDGPLDSYRHSSPYQSATVVAKVVSWVQGKLAPQVNAGAI